MESNNSVPPPPPLPERRRRRPLPPPPPFPPPVSEDIQEPPKLTPRLLDSLNETNDDFDATEDAFQENFQESIQVLQNDDFDFGNATENAFQENFQVLKNAISPSPPLTEGLEINLKEDIILPTKAKKKKSIKKHVVSLPAKFASESSVTARKQAPIHGVTSFDLQHGKRLLRSVKHEQSKPTIKVNKAAVFDSYKGDINKDRLPLQYAIKAIQSKIDSSTITSIDLTGLDQLTDVFFYVLKTVSKELDQVTHIYCQGCTYLSDTGVEWAASCFQTLKEINVSGCRLVTEQSLEILLDKRSIEMIHMQGTGVTTIPPKRIERPDVDLSVLSCQLVSPPLQILQKYGKEYYEPTISNDGINMVSMYVKEMTPMKDFKLVIWSEFIDFSMVRFLQGNDTNSTRPTISMSSIDVDIDSTPIRLHAYEASVFKTFLDSSITDGSLFMVPYEVPSTLDDGLADSLAKLVCQVLVKGKRFRVMLLGIGVDETSAETNRAMGKLVDENVKKKGVEMAKIRSTLRDTSNIWGNLDFHDQQVFGRQATQTDKLQSSKFISTYVDNKNQENRLKFLTELGHSLMANSTLHHQHLHQLQAHLSSSNTPDFFTIEEWENILPNDRHLSDSYKGSILSAAFRVIASTGSIIHMAKQPKKPVITNIAAVETITQQIFKLWQQNQHEEDRKRMPLNFCSLDVLRWSENDVLSSCDSIGNKQEDMIKAVLLMLEKSGTLLRVPCYRTKEEQSPWAYILYDYLPNESHVLLEDYWMPRVISDLFVQVNWFYHFPAGCPDSVLALFFRNCLKICHPTLLWKSGLMCQHGGIQVLCRMTYNENRDMPVLAVCARAPVANFFKPQDNGEETLKTSDECLWSAMAIFTSLLDNVLQRLQVYAEIKIPCRTCLQSQNLEELMKATNVTWVTPVTALQSQGCHKSCSYKSGGQTIPGAMKREDMVPPKGMVLPLPRHHQGQCDLLQRRTNTLYTLCFLCGNCSSKGLDCEKNGIPGKSALHCGCDKALAVCPKCGICSTCQHFLHKVHNELYPGVSSTQPFFLKRNGKVVTKEEYAQKGSILTFSKPTRLHCHASMLPEIFNYWEICITEKHTTSSIVIEFRKGNNEPLLDYHLHRSLINVYKENGEMQNSRKTEYGLDTYDVLGFKVTYDDSCANGPLQRTKPGEKIAMEISINGYPVKTVNNIDYTPLKPRIYTDVSSCSLWFSWKTIVNDSFRPECPQKDFETGMLLEVYSKKTARLMAVVNADSNDNSGSLVLEPAVHEGTPDTTTVVVVLNNLPVLHPVGWHLHHRRSLQVYDIKEKKWREITGKQEVQKYLDMLIAKGMTVAPHGCFNEVQTEADIPHFQNHSPEEAWDVLCYFPFLTITRLKSAFFSNNMIKQLREPMSYNQAAVLTPCMDKEFWRGQRSTPGSFRVTDILDPLNLVLTPLCTYEAKGASASHHSPWHYHGHLVHSTLEVPAELRRDCWVILFVGHLLLALQPRVTVPARTKEIQEFGDDEPAKLINNFFWHLCLDEMLSIAPTSLIPQLHKIIFPGENEAKLQVHQKIKQYILKGNEDCDIKESEDHNLYCPAHSIDLLEDTLGENGEVTDEVAPYLPMLETLKLHQVSTFPTSLSNKLHHLAHLEFGDKLEYLPDGLAACKNLRTLILKNSLIKKLPGDLVNMSLTKLDISACPIRPLPDMITELTTLQSLLINDMLLLQLPVNICHLKDLRVLEANRNLLTNLPPKFERLSRLKILQLAGYVGTTINSAILENDPQTASCLKKLEEERNNLEEGSNQNAFNFCSFPRFGTRKSELVITFGLKTDIASDDTIVEDDISGSGVPKAVFSLKSLEELVLSHQALRYIPSQISNLKRLKKLDVSHNPLLISLPASLGSLHVTELDVRECPLMKTPPVEVRAKGSQATVAYLARLQSGSVTCKRTKLMLVGLGGAGKTSLVQALLDEKLTSGNVDVDGQMTTEVTDGIDICIWKTQAANSNVTFSVWDFAGQTVYYNTHQFFLSNRGIYLLLWNVRLGHEHAGLHFWLGSITVHAPKAPIFVIGTHIDEVARSELPLQEFKNKYPMIAGFHFISSKTGQGISGLRKQMLEVTLNQPYMGELIPEVWLKFENAVIEERSVNSIIEYKRLEDLAGRSGIFNTSELTQAVQFLHDLGSLQHFKSEFLKDRVVINPQWIVDVMACVVSVKDSPIKDGKFNHQDVGKVWSDYPAGLHNWLLRLTEEFDLTFPLSDQDANIVPCLLPDSTPQIDWPTNDSNKRIQENKMIYIFEYLPAGLFNRVQVRLYQYSDASVIWKKGSLLNKNDHKALVLQTKDNEVEVKAYGPRPDNVLFLVHEVIETLVAESFQGVSYNYYITCPDCLSQKVKDPAYFSASMVRKASSRQAPFLQCNTNFHVISMTDLHANMPPANNQDYDLHLSVALEGLASLRKNLATDVFVSYSEKDSRSSSKSNRLITPAKVKDDLIKDGFKCFFPSSSQPMQQLGIALRDARIFLILMSDSYADEPKCVNLFNYARFTMNKPIMLVQIGSSQNWKKSKLGLLLAQEVFVNMQKPDVYPMKFSELTSRLRSNSDVQENEKKEHPTCFISYCWQNSRRAKEKGSRCPEEALGFGDPREIKDYLQSQGIDCWIDLEQAGKKGLFEDIADGLRHAKVVVACISDEYAASNNCRMEFRFAKVLNLPIILAVVGTGASWRNSEVGMLSLNYKMVNFQQPSESAVDKLVQLVNDAIPSQELNQELETKALESNDQNTSNASFQELYELAQRKFLRQIAQYAENAGDIYPRLIVLDFTNDSIDEQASESGGSRPSSARITRRETSRKSSIPATVVPPRLSPVFKILCEHDEGWHPYEEAIDAKGSEVMETLPEFSPYLSRIMSLLQQSSSTLLALTSTDHGKAFLKWLKELPQAEKLDFGDVYKTFRKNVMKTDSQGTMGQLSRCHLPNGKTIWLCPDHQKTTRLTVLDKDILESQRHSEIIGDEAVSMLMLGEEGLNWRTQWLPFWKDLQGQNENQTDEQDDEEMIDNHYDSSSDDNFDKYDDVKSTQTQPTDKTPPRTEHQATKENKEESLNVDSHKETKTEDNQQNGERAKSPMEELKSVKQRNTRSARRLKTFHSGISLTDMTTGPVSSSVQPMPPVDSRASTARQKRRDSARERLLKAAQATVSLSRQPTSTACVIL